MNKLAKIAKMAESIEDIIKNGFGTWKRNIKIGIPYLLSSMLNISLLLILALISIVLGILVFSQIIPDAHGGADNMPDISNMMGSLVLTMGSILLIMIASVVISFTLLATLVSAFFSSGAIGMAKEATLTGKTSLSEMIESGMKKFLSLFFAELIIFFLGILGFLLFIPAVIAFLSKAINVGISLMALAIAVFITYQLVLSILLLLVPYAIVAGDLGAVAGIRKSYGVFMKNKLSVIFLLFILRALEWGGSLVVGVITSCIAIVPIAGFIVNIGVSILYGLFLVLVITPLSAIWFTRFYLDRTGDWGNIKDKADTKTKGNTTTKRDTKTKEDTTTKRDTKTKEDTTTKRDTKYREDTKQEYTENKPLKRSKEHKKITGIKSKDTYISLKKQIER